MFWIPRVENYMAAVIICIVILLQSSVSKQFTEYEDDCQCVTSCFCSNHFCTPPRFPDFLGFFKSTLRHLPNLANLTRDLSSKLLRHDCLTFAPLLRTDWQDFDRLVCSSLQSALEADALLKMAVDETCSGADSGSNLKNPRERYGVHPPMNMESVAIDFKKRRGGRENDDDDDEVEKIDSFLGHMTTRFHRSQLIGLNFDLKRNESIVNRHWESSSHEYDDEKGSDDDDDGYDTFYEPGTEVGLEDSGRSLMRSQWEGDGEGRMVLTKQGISLVVILTSILLSIILLAVIFYRIRKKQSSLPKENIPTKKLASHPWYNGTNSYQEKETSFIEDHLNRNYKTHPVKRYL